MPAIRSSTNSSASKHRKSGTGQKGTGTAARSRKRSARKASSPAKPAGGSPTATRGRKTPPPSSTTPANRTRSAPPRPSASRKLSGELGSPNEPAWREYVVTRNPEIRNRLMEEYLPVVSFIAERLLLTLPRSVDVEDLKSAGTFGLMDAIDGFDIDRGIKFKTYCSNRIRGAILDELRSQDWVPRLVRLKAHQIARAQAAIEARHCRSPTHAEMAAELGVGLSDYSQLAEEASPHTVRSLSESWDDGSGDQAVEKIDFIRDERSFDPADLLNQEDVMRAIIRSLNRKEKQIILMYYRDGLTMKQIGSVLQLTESRVCQIHSNVMKKLKLHLEDARQRLML
jgi:RNA polymerase sigma factor for flagellar operon FliA